MAEGEFRELRPRNWCMGALGRQAESGVYPKGMGSAIRKWLLAEVGWVEWRTGSAEGAAQRPGGDEGGAAAPGSLTLSVLPPQGQVHAPAHIHTNSHTHA